MEGEGLITRVKPSHLLNGEELAGVQVHPEVDLTERAGPDQLPLPPPDRRILLSTSAAAPAPSSAAAAVRLVWHRRQHAARRRGVLGDEP